jgi:hypothetical protein
MTKLRMSLTFVMAVQVALVLAAAGHAGDKGKDSAKTTSSSTAVQPGFHRGG